MKTFSPALTAHLQQSLTTLATCIRIERTDGMVFGFTTHDLPLVISDPALTDGLRYEPAASFNPKDIASGLNLDTDNTEVEALLDSSTLTEDDLRAGKWDYAAFRIFQVNWADLSMGDKKDRIGHLAQVQVMRQSFIGELLGLMEAYGTTICEVTSAGCRARFGDHRCKINLSDFTYAGTVTSAELDLYTFEDTGRAEADGTFTDGTIEFTSGDLDGERHEIKSFAGGVFITKTPLNGDATGCSYVAVAGCPKTREFCVSVGNIVNFRGEPWLRGMDALIQVGRRQ